MKVSQSVKRVLKKTFLAAPWSVALACRLSREQPRIFMYHRFGPVGGQDPNKLDVAVFDWQLEQISRRFRVVHLKDYILWQRERRPMPANLAILTVDYGYRDCYELTLPRLKGRGLAATFFPVVNFVERGAWLWPDRLRYILADAPAVDRVFSFNEQTFSLRLSSRGGRDATWRTLCDFAIAGPNQRREELLAQLEGELKVDVPEKALPPWGPVSWEQLRELQASGFEIGSHTMNHPILSRIDPAQLPEEVAHSKKILEARLGTEVTTFCYPNSQAEDINETVVKAVREAGYLGAAFGPEPKSFDPYRIGRTGPDQDQVDFLWKLSGSRMELIWAKVIRPPP